MLGQLADNLPQIVWVTRPDGTHEYYNRNWYEFTGLSMEASTKEGLESAGKGSRFTVLLSIVALAAARTSPQKRASSPVDEIFPANSLRGFHVMIVDDEESVRDLVALTLTKCGASVTVASSVDDALGLLATMTPNVIISDIAMPGIDGYAFGKTLRARPGVMVPMIALTAYASVQDRERALAVGFDSHLSKPVDPVVLVRTIAESRGPGPIGHEAKGRSAA